MKLLSSFLVVCALVLPRGAFAQSNNSNDDIVKNTQNDLVVVGAAGLGGAVLGLSTLSFYDKPSKHVSNIWMGAAIGIIAGVILVAVGHAQKSQDSLDDADGDAMFSPKTTPDFGTDERYAWHIEKTLPTAQPTMQSSFWTTRF